ncbi:uncharacterized protein MYCFIDRAFT_171962 [Pseudocercospora fijiensis CIRAD86]|uniref:Uncharacterized protein n=1 Tax=Pseudocercospora fijiensis (strain CIRAD86) TaxID=383855 RepID=M3ANJ6_PSEFD|nr:uncharacterized protein MYCFIDRAFT_171962 [Pseudocercospora fijiensis CIRAD86]EME86166.1 hypothetical protein MYCFIDRAFT_171962 [Pseudocercospora fijiensis CIRAD86]
MQCMASPPSLAHVYKLSMELPPAANLDFVPSARQKRQFTPPFMNEPLCFPLHKDFSNYE